MTLVWLVVAACSGAVIATPPALYLGAKIHGRLPLRSPSNATRIENAETDVKLAELGRRRRQEELNFEHDELQAHARLAEARRQLEQSESRAREITDGKGADLLVVRVADALAEATGFPVDERDPDTIVALLRREFEGTSRALVAAGHLIEAVTRAEGQRRLPAYVTDAAAAYRRAQPGGQP